MGRFFGVSGKNLVWVASGECPDGGLPVPPDLHHLSGRALLRDFQYVKGQLVRKDRDIIPGEARVAFVGVYGINCGISTYSEALRGPMAEHFGESMVFAEHSDQAPKDEPRVVRCWKRGEPLTDLVAKLRAYDPDVVYVQHEYGIFPCAAHWLSFLSAMGDRRVIVTLHSVYEHRDKVVCEAACPEIFVHTEIARDVLRTKGITAPIRVLPHGCYPMVHAPLWNIYRSKHRLLQFGFGFRYKGWETSLRVVEKLKERFPDVFFTGLLSRSPFCGKDADLYLDELRDLARALDIEENVSLLPGYRSESVLDSFFSTNDVAIFPYKDNGAHTVFGCSGAARRAMSTGLPVVTSPAPLFHDLSEVVPQAWDVDGLAEAVGKLFDPEQAKAQRARQAKFLEERSWSAVAARMVSLLNIKE